jgi:hypothetical protein
VVTTVSGDQRQSVWFDTLFVEIGASAFDDGAAKMDVEHHVPTFFWPQPDWELLLFRLAMVLTHLNGRTR